MAKRPIRPKTVKDEFTTDLPNPSEVQSMAANDNEVEQTNERKKTIGRPKSTHGRRATSVMVDPEIWRKMKFVALSRNVNIADVVNDAFAMYLKAVKNEKHLPR